MCIHYFVIEKVYSNFKNHTFFGSAKEKVVNFKSKVGEIQNYLTEISTSLNLSGI